MQTEVTKPKPKSPPSQAQLAVDAGDNAQKELDELAREVDRVESELRAALARKRDANTAEEHAGARDDADWLATRVEVARERLSTRHTELSPLLQAKTIVEARERVAAARDAHTAYFARLADYRATIETHVLALLTTFDVIRTETEAQRRLATMANTKVGKLPITERAGAPTVADSFAFVNDRVRQLLDGGLSLHFPQQ